MEGALIAIFTVLGMVLASFLNVCIDRLPACESLLFPPSHCPACQKRLRPKDLVPVFSYLALRGRCRYCGAPIPRRILGLEVTLGAIFPLLYWHYGLTPAFGLTAFYCSLFITVFLIDLERGLILNRMVVPAMIAAILISVFLRGNIDSFALGNLTVSLPPGIISALIGGGVGFGITLLVILASRGGMGFGDAKLAGLIGLVAGFPMVFFALISAAILGGIVAVALLALKKKRGKEAIPFGPMLSVAAIITLLWGTNILIWYLGLF